MSHSDWLTSDLLCHCYHWIEGVKTTKLSGGQGKIFFGYNKSDNQKLCIKFVDITEDSQHKHFDEELEFLNSLNHPNILNIYHTGVHQFQDKVLGTIMTPWVDGGDLCSYLIDLYESNTRMTEEFFLKIMNQLINVVCYLHKNGIIHHDIKPENILLSDDFNTIYLIDYGFSVKLGKESNNECHCNNSTKIYASPEQTKGHSHSFPIDIYQLGKVGYMLQQFTNINTENGNHASITGILDKMCNDFPGLRPSIETIQCKWSVLTKPMSVDEGAVIGKLEPISLF